jgi:hypothetical protein
MTQSKVVTIRKLRNVNQQTLDLLVSTLRDGGYDDDQIVKHLREHYTEEVKPTLADAVVKAFEAPSTAPINRETANTMQGAIRKAFLDGGFDVPDEPTLADSVEKAKARKAAREKFPAVEHDMTARLRKNAEAKNGR